MNEITELIEQTRYFAISNFHLGDIFHKIFLDSFINTGKLECVSPAGGDEQNICIERNVLHLKTLRDECHDCSITELIQFRIKEDDEFMCELNNPF